jgi:hypothetical protein
MEDLSQGILWVFPFFIRFEGEGGISLLTRRMISATISSWLRPAQSMVRWEYFR